MFDGVGRAFAVLFWGFILFFVVTVALSAVLFFSPKSNSDQMRNEYQRGFRDGAESVYKWAKEKGIFLPAE